MTDTESAFSLESINLRLARLYAAADALVESVLDPAVIEAAPLHHRAQALDAVSRFIHRLEKHKAAVQAEEEEEEQEETQIYLEFIDSESPEEDLDMYVALELESPGRFSDVEGVLERIEYLQENDPDALDRLDPKIARMWFGNHNRGDDPESLLMATRHLSSKHHAA